MTEVAVRWSLTAGEAAPGRRLLVHALAQFLGVTPSRVEVSRLCPTCGSSEHGRPVVVEPRATRVSASLSTAPGITAVALTEAGAVGIDVEEIARTAFAGFADVALHPLERADDPRARGRVWTRKEALLKALGTGLHVDPRTVRVSGADESAGLVSMPSGLASAPVWIEDLTLPVAYAGSLAVVADLRPRLVVSRVEAAAWAGGASGGPARRPPRPAAKR